MVGGMPTMVENSHTYSVEHRSSLPDVVRMPYELNVVAEGRASEGLYATASVWVCMQQLTVDESL